MFGDFLTRLLAPAPVISDLDANLALAALLVRIARTDGHYAPAEIARIDRLLAERFALTHAAAQDLRRQAETLEQEAPDTVRFTRAIKAAVPYADRVGVVEALWAVGRADGTREAEEDALMRMTASLLGVNGRDSGLARQRVEARG